jgi:NAD(P)-dependent dehydrogenase (short-subunit alcohol dehydrogenase family)
MGASEFDGKTMLITGGGTGIGKGTAEYFLERGARVTIAGPDQAILDGAVAELIRKAGSNSIRAILCDVREEDQVQAAVELAADGGNLDIMFANAGTGLPGPVQLLTKDQWRFPFDVNVVGTALCFKHAGKIMKRHGGGVMIGVSSVEGIRASAFHATYNAAKAAVESLIAASAREFGPFNIRVNGIRPGYVETDATVRALSDEAKARCVGESLLGRPGKPLDIAKVVAFFASEQAEWVTGQVLSVCGGLTVHNGDDYENIARRVFGDEAVEESKRA